MARLFVMRMPDEHFPYVRTYIDLVEPRALESFQILLQFRSALTVLFTQKDA